MITVQDLHFSYGKNRVIEGMDWEVKPGHIYGLLGKNGSGKTTLFHNICGLLFPKSGSIQAFNLTPRDRLPEFLQKIFIIPEEFWLPDISMDNLLKYYVSFYPDFDTELYRTLLSEFEVPNQPKLSTMSYGQKKKALISFGMACQTPILLMDEPTNGLDVVSKSQFRKVLARHILDQRTIIISTHQVKDLENLIDRIAILDDGQIIFDYTIQEIANRLHFTHSPEQAVANNSLYAEFSLSGYSIVSHNQNFSESEVDLELLYKTIISKPIEIKQIFIS